MRTWLIIPVKSLDGGKSRLAKVLSGTRRRALNERLLRRVLRIAAAFPGLRRTLVVSRCPAALALARRWGAHAVQERRPGGLNAAVAQAVGMARRQGAGALLVAACDLPYLRARDLRALARGGGSRQRCVLLCPD